MLGQRIARKKLDRDRAEALALQGLAWLAANPDELEAFLGQAGMDASQLKRSAGAAEVLAGVMDYLLADETRLLAFCADAECDPGLPGRARGLLPGGYQE